MTSNEFAKNFIMSTVDRVIDNMDAIFEATPEWYGDFTEKEISDIKSQLIKRADGVRGYYGLNNNNGTKGSKE